MKAENTRGWRSFIIGAVGGAVLAYVAIATSGLVAAFWLAFGMFLSDVLGAMENGAKKRPDALLAQREEKL